jgi:endonuclease/exonuclease/phosphatase (EEP) superfamily protein YafD
MISHKKITLNKFKILLLVAFLCLIIIHFILKDRFQVVSVLFYACPLPLIIIFGIFVTALFLKRKTLFYTLSVVLLAMSIYFFGHYFGSELEKKPSGATSRILFWNVSKNQPLPTDILIKHIKQSNPEIMTLVEALNVSEEDLNTLRSSLPNYTIRALKGEMLIAVKGTIEFTIFDSENDSYKYNYITVNIDNKPISVMIVDVYASPLLNKRIPLEIIHHVAKENNTDILVGDLNTPYESVFFNDFKADFKSFHLYSLGMTSTWPTPLPMIEIDQIWVARSFQPIKMKKFSYEISDHKMLIAEFQLNP